MYEMIAKLFRQIVGSRPMHLIIALCQRPILLALIVTVGTLVLTAFRHASEGEFWHYLFKEPGHLLQQSHGTQEWVQVVICFLFLGAFAMVYIGMIRPVVAAIQDRKSLAWRDRWWDVDRRVQRLMYLVGGVFLSWALMFMAYLVFPGAWYEKVDVLVWLNGVAFLLTWFSMRGRFVDHEQRKAIDNVLDRMNEKEETDEEIIYDFFTPWEHKGEALLTKTGVGVHDVENELKLEKQALEARIKGQPLHGDSELVAAEGHNMLGILALGALMIVVPAVLFSMRFFSGEASGALATMSSFYVACVVAGTGIGLVATRLASVYFDLPAVIVAAIVLYAAIQPAFAYKDLIRDVRDTEQTLAAAVELESRIEERMQREDLREDGSTFILFPARMENRSFELFEPRVARQTSQRVLTGDAVTVADASWWSMFSHVIEMEERTFNLLQAGLFLYALFGKVVIGAVFVKLLASGRLHYYMYYLQRSRALLHVHRRLTTATFPGTSITLTADEGEQE